MSFLAPLLGAVGGVAGNALGTLAGLGSIGADIAGAAGGALAGGLSGGGTGALEGALTGGASGAFLGPTVASGASSLYGDIFGNAASSAASATSGVAAQDAAILGEGNFASMDPSTGFPADPYPVTGAGTGFQNVLNAAGDGFQLSGDAAGLGTFPSGGSSGGSGSSGSNGASGTSGAAGAPGANGASGALGSIANALGVSPGIVQLGAIAAGLGGSLFLKPTIPDLGNPITGGALNPNSSLGLELGTAFQLNAQIAPLLAQGQAMEADVPALFADAENNFGGATGTAITNSALAYLASNPGGADLAAGGGLIGSAGPLVNAPETGVLPAGMEDAIKLGVTNAQTGIRSNYSRLGDAGSSAEAQDLAAAQMEGQAQIAEQELAAQQAGLAQISAGEGLQTTGLNLNNFGLNELGAGEQFLAGGRQEQSITLNQAATQASLANSAFNEAMNFAQLPMSVYGQIANIQLQDSQELQNAIATIAAAAAGGTGSTHVNVGS